MPKNILQNFLVFSLVYKPVSVLLCDILSLPHVLFLIVCLVLEVYVMLKSQYVKISIIAPISISLTMATLLSIVIINSLEYYYNIILLLNYLFLIIIISQTPLVQSQKIIWNALLLLVIAISLLDSIAGGASTHFAGRSTMIGYDNPLWAGRDLCIICAYLILSKYKIYNPIIIIIILFIIFFLEARGAIAALIAFLIYSGRIKSIIYVALIMPPFIYSVLEINPASFSLRMWEWKNIIFNLDSIPFLGFGAQNYKEIPFTQWLGLYAHNWVLDYLLSLGFLGLLLATITLIGLKKAFVLKSKRQLDPFLSIPMVYGIIGLSQGSLISSLLALSILPVIHIFSTFLINKPT